MVIYATWVSSTGMADFDLLQIFPIPLCKLDKLLEISGIKLKFVLENWMFVAN